MPRPLFSTIYPVIPLVQLLGGTHIVSVPDLIRAAIADTGSDRALIRSGTETRTHKWGV